MFKRICTILLFMPVLALGSVLPLEGGPFAPGAPMRTNASYASFSNELASSDDFLGGDWLGTAYPDHYTNMPDPFGGFQATQFNYSGAGVDFGQRYQLFNVPNDSAHDAITIQAKVKWVSGNPRINLRIYDPEHATDTTMNNRIDFDASGNITSVVDAAEDWASYTGPDADGWYTLYVSSTGFAGHSTVRFAFMPFAASGRSADQAVLVAGAQLQYNSTPTEYRRTPVPASPTLASNYVADSGDFSQDGWSGTGSAIAREYYYGPTKELLSQTFTFATGDNNRNFWQRVDSYSSLVNVSFMTKHISGTPSPAFVLYDNDAAAIVGGVAVDYDTDGTYSYTSYGGSTPVIEEIEGGYLRTSVYMPYYKDNVVNLEVYPFSVGASGDEVVVTGMQITDGAAPTDYHQDPQYDYWLPIAAHKWADAYEFDAYPERYWEIGQYELWEYQAYPVFTPSSVFDDDLLRAVNPDIELGYYVNLPNSYPINGGSASVGSYSRYLYDAAHPTYVALDTEGEFWYPWNAQYGLNATVDGFAETIGAAIIQMINDHPELDPPYHLMWDYFAGQMVSYSSEPEYINANSLDLDQDGIAHESDSDERAAMYQGWYELLDYINARLPAGVTTVANGNFFQASSDLRSRLDGLYVEGSGAYWDVCGSYVELPAMIDPDCPTNINALLDDFRVGSPVIMESQPGGAESATNEQASALNLGLAMLLWEEDRPFYGVVQGTDCDGAESRTTHCLPEWGTFQYWGQVGPPTNSYYEIAPNTYQRDFENGYCVFRVYSSGTGTYPFQWYLYDGDGNEIYSYTTGTGDTTDPAMTYGDVALDASGSEAVLFYSANFTEPCSFEVEWRKNAEAWSTTLNIAGYNTTTGSRIFYTGETPVEDDTYTVRVRATDVSSNVSDWIEIETVTVPDVTAPVLSGGFVSYDVAKVQTDLVLNTTLAANEPSLVQYYWFHNEKPAVYEDQTIEYATTLDQVITTSLDVAPGDSIVVWAVAENEVGLESGDYLVGGAYFEADTTPPEFLGGSISLRESSGLVLIDWVAYAAEQCTYEIRWSQSKGALAADPGASKVIPLDVQFSGTIVTNMPWVHLSEFQVEIQLTDDVGNSGFWELVGTALVDDPPVAAPTVSGVTGTFTSEWDIAGSNFGAGPQSGSQVVNVGNAAVFEECTVLVEQTVTSWADDAITATADSGSFGAGTYYLYVTNDNGDTSVGWAVNIAAAGDPDIVSVSGTSTTTWTITGNNFTDDAGEDVPLLWDDFEGGAVGSTIQSGGLWTQRVTGPYIEAEYSNEYSRSVNGPQVCKFWSYGLQDYLVVGELLGVSTTGKYFFSVWMRMQRAPAEDVEAVQYKCWRLMTNNGTSDGYGALPGPYWYYKVETNSGTSLTSNAPNATTVYTDYGLGGREPNNVWHLYQIEVDQGDVNTSNATLRIYQNGADVTRNPESTSGFLFLDSSDGGTGPVKQVFLGHTVVNVDIAPEEDSIIDWHYDDVYFTNTWRRVELGNSPVYGSCTVREIQPLLTWSDGSPGTITATANQGSFDGETAYLFVVNADGDVSAGYPVTID